MSTAIRVRKIAVTGVLSSLVIVLGITGIGFIRIPPFSLTIMHVPVIIGAILEGPAAGFAIGLLFGVFSLVQTAILPGTEIAFLNPLISILPRLFIGPVAWLVYRAIAGKTVSGDEQKSAPRRAVIETVAIAISAFAGTLTNTVLVLGTLGLFKYYPWDVIFLTAVSNSPLEAAFAIVIVLAVVSAWKRISLGGKSRLSRESTLP
ncbi:MAG: ECF transporter S component [Spirochaetaceae bacterium]|nr:ECF transporter S component [Spirochaetaceae bacterium]